MPSIMGLDIGSENPRRLAIRIVAELIAAGLFYIICIVGPLWPIGRLVLLRSNEAALAADDIRNPHAQRMFSRVALVVLAAAGYLEWDGHSSGDIRSWIGMVMLLMLYVWITVVVFERELSALIGRIHEWVSIPVATALFVLALAAGRKDDPDDCPTELPPNADVRATGGPEAIFGIAFVLALLGVLIWALWHLMTR